MERHQQRDGAKQPNKTAIPARSPLQQSPLQQSQHHTASSNPGKPVRLGSVVILGSAWIGVLVIALIAISGLLSPDSSTGNRTTGAAIARNTAERAQAAKQHSQIPLWLFGAIALSCAAGSILVSQQVNRPPRPRKVAKPRRLKPRTPLEDTASEAIAQPMPMPQPLPQPQSFSTTSSLLSLAQQQTPPIAPPSPFVAPATLMQLAQQQLAQSRSQPRSQPAVEKAVEKAAVAVTVVPSEASHPLDWGEASLAEQLDIRKRRSVSFLL